MPTCKHGIAAPPFIDCAICIQEDFEMSGCHVPLDETKENFSIIEKEILSLRDQINACKRDIKRLEEYGHISISKDKDFNIINSLKLQIEELKRVMINLISGL